jgi:hypothetical protein
MKLQYLSGALFCLFILVSSVFGDDDVDTDTTVQFLLKEFQSMRNRVSVLENVIGKQSEIIQNQNVRIVELEALLQSGRLNEDDSLRHIQDGDNQSRDHYTEANGVSQSAVDAQSTPMSLIQHMASQERKSESMYIYECCF